MFTKNGEWIRLHRQKAGMTQEQLAEAVGVTRKTINKWEADEATPKKAHHIAMLYSLYDAIDWADHNEQ